MLFRLALRLNAQRVTLKIPSQFRDFFRHSGRKHQSATLGRGCVQDIFQILAKPQIKHLVCLIQHSRPQARQIKRATVDMVAQSPRRADNNMRAPVQGTLFGAVIHAAHASGNLRARWPIKPIQFARHLQRQFASGGNHQGHRGVGIQKLIRAAQQLIGNRNTKGHGLAGTRLCRNQHIAVLRFGGQNSHLHGCQGFIALSRQCRSQRRGDT